MLTTSLILYIQKNPGALLTITQNARRLFLQCRGVVSLVSMFLLSSADSLDRCSSGVDVHLKRERHVTI